MGRRSVGWVGRILFQVLGFLGKIAKIYTQAATNANIKKRTIYTIMLQKMKTLTYNNVSLSLVKCIFKRII